MNTIPLAVLRAKALSKSVLIISPLPLVLPQNFPDPSRVACLNFQWRPLEGSPSLFPEPCYVFVVATSSSAGAGNSEGASQ